MNKYASCDYYAFVGQLNLHRIQDKYGNIFKIFENQLEYLKNRREFDYVKNIEFDKLLRRNPTSIDVDLDKLKDVIGEFIKKYKSVYYNLIDSIKRLLG